MLHKIIYFSVLALCGGYALLRGGHPERIGACIWIAASVLSPLMASTRVHRFYGFEPGILALDLVTLAGLLWLSLVSNRYWPLWITAIHLLGCLGHIAKAVNTFIDPWAYYVTVALGGYPICLILAIGAHRHRQRMAKFGADPSWSGS